MQLEMKLKKQQKQLRKTKVRNAAEKLKVKNVVKESLAVKEKLSLLVLITEVTEHKKILELQRKSSVAKRKAAARKRKLAN